MKLVIVLVCFKKKKLRKFTFGNMKLDWSSIVDSELDALTSIADLNPTLINRPYFRYCCECLNLDMDETVFGYDPINLAPQNRCYIDMVYMPFSLKQQAIEGDFQLLLVAKKKFKFKFKFSLLIEWIKI